jgi:hypothetical protein
MPRTRKYQTNGERQAAYRRRCAKASDADLMNKTPGSIPSAPGRRRWKAMVKAASALLDCADGEMQDYFDQRSETWQDSQAGESIAEMLESVHEALVTLEDVTHQTDKANPT